MPKLIGLTGKARSGKDTIGNILAWKFHAETISFAYPIKHALHSMFQGELDWTYWDGENKEKVIDWIGKSPRQLMQLLGTEYGRNLIGENFWTSLARKRIERALGLGQNVAVTDVRFENEAQMIRSMGGEIWHVYRKDAQNVNAHASEAGITFDVSDIWIDNNHSLDILKRNVELAFEDTPEI
jgi:hypothetical protein